MPRSFLSDPFNPWSNGDKCIFGFTFGTGFGHSHGKPRLMTHSPPARAVLDKPAIGIGTFKLFAASLANDKRRITSAVKIEHGLLAPRQDSICCLNERRGHVIALFRRVIFQIYQINVWKCHGAGAFRQYNMGIAPCPRIDETFQGRCCRRENNRMSRYFTANDGHITRIINDPLLLFVRGVMFFIDNNELEIGKWQIKS